MEERNAVKPNAIDIRTGVPILMAYEIEKIESLYYHEVKEGQYSFLDRAVNKGAALISNTEMDEYFNTFSEKGYRFAITSNDGAIKYYRILFNEPPVDIGSHNVNVFVYDTSDKIIPQAESLSTVERSYISAAIAGPYVWTTIDEESARALLTTLVSEGNTFTTTTDRGTETIRIMYIGPFSEELGMPEFQTMYGLASSTGGQ